MCCDRHCKALLKTTKNVTSDTVLKVDRGVYLSLKCENEDGISHWEVCVTLG